MLMIFWNPNDLHLIDAMPKMEKLSTRYYVNHILVPIFQQLIPAGQCKLVIHTDNSQYYTDRVVFDFVLQRKVKFALHPPDSPNLAPSDFLLFGSVKQELRCSRFRTAKVLFAEARKLVSEISAETLLNLFHDWTARCDSVIASDGNYFE
jgi:hypothetical protein